MTFKKNIYRKLGLKLEPLTYNKSDFTTKPVRFRIRIPFDMSFPRFIYGEKKDIQ